MSGSWLYQELTDALDNRKDERNAESKILRILRVGSNAKFSLTSDGICSVITITDDDIIPPFSLTADNSEGLHSSCVLHVQHFHFICRDIYDINNHLVRYPFLHITSMDRVEEKQCTFVLSGADDIITAMDRDKLVACTPGILRKQLQGRCDCECLDCQDVYDKVMKHILSQTSQCGLPFSIIPTTPDSLGSQVVKDPLPFTVPSPPRSQHPSSSQASSEQMMFAQPTSCSSGPLSLQDPQTPTSCYDPTPFPSQISMHSHSSPSNEKQNKANSHNANDEEKEKTPVDTSVLLAQDMLGDELDRTLQEGLSSSEEEVANNENEVTIEDLDAVLQEDSSLSESEKVLSPSPLLASPVDSDMEEKLPLISSVSLNEEKVSVPLNEEMSSQEEAVEMDSPLPSPKLQLSLTITTTTTTTTTTTENNSSGNATQTQNREVLPGQLVLPDGEMDHTKDEENCPADIEKESNKTGENKEEPSDPTGQEIRSKESASQAEELPAPTFLAQSLPPEAMAPEPETKATSSDSHVTISREPNAKADPEMKTTLESDFKATPPDPSLLAPSQKEGLACGSSDPSQAEAKLGTSLSLSFNSSSTTHSQSQDSTVLIPLCRNREKEGTLPELKEKKQTEKDNTVKSLLEVVNYNVYFEDSEEDSIETHTDVTPINTLTNVTPINTLTNETPINTLTNVTPINTLTNVTPIMAPLDIQKESVVIEDLTVLSEKSESITSEDDSIYFLEEPTEKKKTVEKVKEEPMKRQEENELEEETTAVESDEESDLELHPLAVIEERENSPPSPERGKRVVLSSQQEETSIPLPRHDVVSPAPSAKRRNVTQLNSGSTSSGRSEARRNPVENERTMKALEALGIKSVNPDLWNVRWSHL